MKSNRFSLRLGALIIWSNALIVGSDAVLAWAEGDATRAVFAALAVPGAVLIGLSVWRAA